MAGLELMVPSGECASHFQQHLKKYPPQVSSRNAAAGWACFIHNEVNDMLKKPAFDCNALGDFYDCGCGDDEKDKSRTARGEDRDSQEQKKVDPATNNNGKDAFPLIEITKAP
jgi:FAD-linked sulfhydryl oxidase